MEKNTVEERFQRLEKSLDEVVEILKNLCVISRSQGISIDGFYSNIIPKIKSRLVKLEEFYRIKHENGTSQKIQSKL